MDPRLESLSWDRIGSRFVRLCRQVNGRMLIASRATRSSIGSFDRFARLNRPPSFDTKIRQDRLTLSLTLIETFARSSKGNRCSTLVRSRVNRFTRPHPRIDSLGNPLGTLHFRNRLSLVTREIDSPYADH